MKAAAETFRGISFVQVNKLPAEQRNLLRESVEEDFHIKILIDNTVVRDCLQYSEYELWFDNVFVAASAENG